MDHVALSRTFLVLAAFLASAVEMVEALTIVLAVGVSRGWRSTLIGAGTATVALAAVVSVLGPAITLIPIDVLRLAVGAGAAVVIVVGVGILVRAPLSRVPENTMKFAVGAMLTSFGTFWGAEGAGVTWPGSDGALLGVLGFVLLVSFGLVAVLRRTR